jgi:hypothetical protein
LPHYVSHYLWLTLTDNRSILRRDPHAKTGAADIADVMDVERLQDAPNKTFAWIKELLYDEITVRGVPYSDDGNPSVAA